MKSDVLFDEVRAGGRIPLIIGRGLTSKAREALGLAPSTLFRLPKDPVDTGRGYTLAQKMVGRACGLPEGKGIRPGTYCEPKMTSVGSQDTTGPMTRDELKDLACLGFSADLVMQSFCHTAAYPKPVDVKTHHTLPEFISTRGGISLRPGDGVIHSWLNRMLLPDTVGTGGDSHTRFPIGISFPAGSGLVDFNDGGVFGVGVRSQQLGISQPGFHGLDAAAQGALVFVAVGDHPLQHHDVAVDVLDDRFLVQVHRAAGGRTFCGSVRQFKGLFDLQVGQAFDFQDAAREDVLLALLGHRQQALLDGVQRDGVDQVAQGHARLQLALEADQHRFRHVQGLSLIHI